MADKNSIPTDAFAQDLHTHCDNAHKHEHDHDHAPHEHNHHYGDHGHHHHEHLHEHTPHVHQPVPQSSAGLSPASVLTVRAACGLSGDMMLSGLAAMADISHDKLQELVEELKLPGLEGCVTLEARFVNHVAGVGCRMALPHEHAHRNLADIRKIIADSSMPEEAKAFSVKAFTLLGEAEAAVHGKAVDEVTFHEVGAFDSIVDTCLVCRIFTMLSPSRFICSPLPLADGSIHCAHGHVPSPAPAVLRLLENVSVCAYAGSGETVTPTAISLLKALGATFGAWPAMTVTKTAISYGSKVFPDAPNGALWAWGVGD